MCRGEGGGERKREGGLVCGCGVWEAGVCVVCACFFNDAKHAHSSDVAIASFLGPTQLSVGYNMVLQAMESWVRPGNEANIAMYWYSRGGGRRD